MPEAGFLQSPSTRSSLLKKIRPVIENHSQPDRFTTFLVKDDAVRSRNEVEHAGVGYGYATENSKQQWCGSESPGRKRRK